METVLYYVIIAIAIIVIALIVLALFGIREQRRQRHFAAQYNAQSIKTFMNGQKNKKLSRQSTPKAKSTKK